MEATEKEHQQVQQEAKIKEEMKVKEPEVEKQEKEEAEEKEQVGGDVNAPKKKRKKRNKKKKKVEGGDAEDAESCDDEKPKDPTKEVKAQENANQVAPDVQENEVFRCLGGWKKPVSIKFPSEKMDGYPENDTIPYKVPRVSAEQQKKREVFLETHLQYLRKGAQIQRQVRRYAQRIIRPGRKLIDICDDIEAYNRKLTAEKGLESGIGFPTGCSLNHVAAHYTPNTGDNTILGPDDVCKIDFGTHIQGRIIDCAFTVAFNPTYDKLLEAVKDSTNTGLREAGVDVRLSDIGAKIEEVMQSYEVEIKGRTYPVKVVRNLNGHSINPYNIHGGKTVPCVKMANNNVRMEEGECYAIETFGSTGKGIVREDGECSHYMKDFHLPNNVKIPGRSKGLFNYITDKYSTLPFCKKWLDRDGQTGHILPLRDLVQNGIIVPYPPLCDAPGSYVAQWEHTFLLRPNCKEILSRGEDF